MSNEYILIKNSFLPFIKYRFLLDEIAKIQIVYKGGIGSQEVLKVYLKKGKKKSFYLTLNRRYEEFIYDAREKNIEVDTSRHPDLK